MIIILFYIGLPVLGIIWVVRYLIDLRRKVNLIIDYTQKQEAGDDRKSSN